MFNKIIILLFFFCFSVFSEKNVVHGPFMLKGIGGVSIGFVKNQDHSISLIEIVAGKERRVDTYKLGDGEPSIETVFFDKVWNKNKVVVLVSWDEKNISATHYKVYIYNYNETEGVGKDECLSNDENLEGYEGYGKSGITFDLKNAEYIRDYLQDNELESVTPCI